MARAGLSDGVEGDIGVIGRDGLLLGTGILDVSRRAAGSRLGVAD